MPSRAPSLSRLLVSLLGTEVFAAYCRLREIPFPRGESDPTADEDLRRWADVLAALAPDRRSQIERDLDDVNELSVGDALDHLLDAADGGELPPATVPAGAPLALWFLLHRPSLFREVLLHHEIRDTTAWRTAHADPHLRLGDLEKRSQDLATGLRRFFLLDSRKGPFCSVEARQLDARVLFAAQVADRPRLIDSFTDVGELALQRLNPALVVLFLYEPKTGAVLLKSHLRSIDRLNALLLCFGQTVLRSHIAPLREAFDLERLKLPFHPLPDGPDMESARVKALHLQYPARFGRRQVKLDTLSSDGPDAIQELLHTHAGPASLRDELRVCYAELQVRLRIAGRGRSHLIRLWPDRCSLNDSVLGERLRKCIERWGLIYA